MKLQNLYEAPDGLRGDLLGSADDREPWVAALMPPEV